LPRVPTGFAGSSDGRPALAATVAPLVAARECADVREALVWASEAGCRGVQLSATEPELRPRDLSQSARRDLAATLARLELACSGIDFFLPPSHLVDPAFVTRALEAIDGALELAAFLGRAPVTIPLGPTEDCVARHAIAASASRLGVEVLLPVVRPEDAAGLAPPFLASVDCASVLGAGGRPEDLVARLAGGGAGGGPRSVSGGGSGGGSGVATLGGVRLVDLWRSGLRGPILEPRESRLEALALRITLETSGFRGLSVIDARQWQSPRRGIEAVLERWSSLVPA